MSSRNFKRLISGLLFVILLATLGSAAKSKQLNSVSLNSTTGAEAQGSVYHEQILKTKRNGINGHGLGHGLNGLIDKTAPDLQFGLALTIPFVSLATEKLIHSLSGQGRGYRSWSDLMSILKLNVGGLVLAAVVGIGALFLIPTIFQNKGILKGFGSNLFDNFIPGGIGGGLNKHFGYGQYENYDYADKEWNKNNNQHNNGGYGYQRSNDDRTGRSEEPTNSTSTIWSSIQSTVSENWPSIQTCGLYAMCLRGRDSNNSSAEYLNHLSELNPFLGQMERAYQLGQNSTVDCATEFKDCEQIPKFVNSMGSYLFS